MVNRDLLTTISSSFLGRLTTYYCSSLAISFTTIDQIECVSLANLATPLVKNLTAVEMQARCEKNLCYKYDEKYNPTHKYAQKQLYILVTDDND